MIEVRIPKEIMNYKEKLFFGLTLRQTICLALAIGINVPLYLFGKDIIGHDLTSWLVMIIAVPVMMIGFFNYNGMTAEKFIAVMFISSFWYPQVRKYKSENLYESIIEKEVKKNGR